MLTRRMTFALRTLHVPALFELCSVCARGSAQRHTVGKHGMISALTTKVKLWDYSDGSLLSAEETCGFQSFHMASSSMPSRTCLAFKALTFSRSTQLDFRIQS